MTMYEIIKKKRDGGTLTSEEIRWFIHYYTKGIIPDYQAAALCMAVYFQGMTKEETFLLTDAMADSGDKLDLSDIDGPTADKHSTGGVGDKTSLVVMPVIASLGAKVAKMTGRGLGHTGGTVDKLESIPGFQTDLKPEFFRAQVKQIGISLISQTGNMTPADKKLYALRDVTATVNQVSLIASSVMSKKLAAGSQNIVLDVKIGSGAFMKTQKEAEELARLMVEIGKNAGRNMTAVLSNMDQPLGYAIGNNLEVKEAVEVLNGRGPKDVRELCITLSAALYASCFQTSLEEGREKAAEAIDSGAALQKLAELVRFQRGNPEVIFHPEQFPSCQTKKEVLAEKDGYLTFMNAEAIGSVATLLGAGRQTKEDTIDYSAGILLCKKTGDFVRAGEPLAILSTNRGRDLYEAEKNFKNALVFGPEKPEEKPLIYKIIS